MWLNSSYLCFFSSKHDNVHLCLVNATLYIQVWLLVSYFKHFAQLTVLLFSLRWNQASIKEYISTNRDLLNMNIIFSSWKLLQHLFPSVLGHLTFHHTLRWWHWWLWGHFGETETFLGLVLNTQVTLVSTSIRTTAYAAKIVWHGNIRVLPCQAWVMAICTAR